MGKRPCTPEVHRPSSQGLLRLEVEVVVVVAVEKVVMVQDQQWVSLARQDMA